MSTKTKQNSLIKHVGRQKKSSAISDNEITSFMRNSLHELNMLTHKLEEFNDFEKHAHIFFSYKEFT